MGAAQYIPMGLQIPAGSFLSSSTFQCWAVWSENKALPDLSHDCRLSVSYRWRLSISLPAQPSFLSSQGSLLVGPLNSIIYQPLPSKHFRTLAVRLCGCWASRSSMLCDSHSIRLGLPFWSGQYGSFFHFPCVHGCTHPCLWGPL